MKRIVFIMIIVISRISGQVIESGQMPFGGLISIYEADTSGAAIDVSALTAPGAAQAWIFTQVLPNPLPDTLTVAENDPFNRTVEQIRITNRFRRGALLDTPAVSYYTIESGRLIEFGSGIRAGDTLFYAVPAHTLPLPLDTGAGWIYESRLPDADGHVIEILLSDSITADAAGSLIIGSDAYYAIRLRLTTTETFRYADGRTETIDRLAYRWIAPYLGAVLEIWSRPGETETHFSKAGQIWRLKATNAEEFGCDPTCDPDYYKIPGFRLDQNAPNPFSKTTEIRYTLDLPSSVNLSIINIRGRTIYSEHRISTQGTYTFRWSGEDQSGRPQPGGVYFYSLQAIPAGKKTQIRAIKRMILIR